MNATNEFEKDFFKLMINSVYGKAIENLWKRIKVRLVKNREGFLKYTRKPTYITRKIFGKNYAAIHEIKPFLTLNKPIYIWFTVVELSKWLMCNFHYNFIKKHFDSELLFTDTDSLTEEIKSDDIYEELFKHKHLFSLSNLPKDWKFFDETNKNIIGKIKDESEGKSRVYWVKIKDVSIKNIDGKESNTAKGVNVTTEFNELENILFKKKSWDIKWEEFKPRIINVEHTKLTKYFYHDLMAKDLF